MVWKVYSVLQACSLASALRCLLSTGSLLQCRLQCPVPRILCVPGIRPCPPCYRWNTSLTGRSWCLNTCMYKSPASLSPWHRNHHASRSAFPTCSWLPVLHRYTAHCLLQRFLYRVQIHWMHWNVLPAHNRTFRFWMYRSVHHRMRCGFRCTHPLSHTFSASAQSGWPALW